MARAIIALIKAYQRWLSPSLGPCCRFQPSCSNYAISALELHGFLKGSFMALWRLCRCHPLGGHGPDPVPGTKNLARD